MMPELPLGGVQIGVESGLANMLLVLSEYSPTPPVASLDRRVNNRVSGEGLPSTGVGGVYVHFSTRQGGKVGS